MHNEIQAIQKNIIDKIIVISLLFLTPTYLVALFRTAEVGLQHTNISYSILFLILIVLTFLRKRLTMQFKIYSIVFIYTVVGIITLWFYGFSGVHYFVIIAIAMMSILANRKPAFMLIALVTVVYIVIGSLFIFKIHEVEIDLNLFSLSILQWTVFILAFIAFSVIFVEGFGELYRALVRNIEDNKRIREELEDSELRWQFSVDGSNLGLWDWNLTNNEVFFSKKWKDMLDYQDDEILHSLDEWESRVHPDDLERAYEVLNMYMSGENEIYQCEYRLRCKDGSFKWIRDRGKIVSYNGDGKPTRMIGTHSDIHAAKMTELELIKSNATKDRFFSIIAHDLKIPFNTMIGFSDLLNENFDDLDNETRKKFIGSIHGGILKTYDLLEDLLLWSRAQRNIVDYSPKSLDLGMVLNEVLDSLQINAESKSIKILHEIPIGTFVYADMYMLSFIFRNIISNAIKFTPRNGKITIKSTAEMKEGKKMVQIIVQDTGIGMGEKYIEQLFDIGKNVSHPGTENEKGTGLGLPVSNEFIKKHGGDIWVKSTPKKGSYFFFTLPQP